MKKYKCKIFPNCKSSLGRPCVFNEKDIKYIKNTRNLNCDKLPGYIQNKLKEKNIKGGKL